MAQFARPDSDVTATNITGGFADIDEATASDADFAYSANNTTAELEVGLSNVTDPAVSIGHVMRLRYAKTNGGVLDGGGSAAQWNVDLYQGSTLIQSIGTAAGTGAWQLHEFTLPASAADAITDYSDLRLRFTTSGGGGSPANRRGMGVSWAELEVPDAGGGATPKTGGDSAGGSEASALSIAFGASDAGAGAESAILTVAHAGTDAAAGAETLEARATATVESGTGADIGATIAITAGPDSGTATEAATLSLTLAVTDAAAGGDAAGAPALATSDLGAGAEVATLSVAIAGSDGGSASETAILATDDSRSATDSAGAGAGEMAALAVALSGADSAAGAESSIVSLAGGDAAAGAEIASLDGALADADTATATEAGSLVGVALATDSAAAVETAALDAGAAVPTSASIVRAAKPGAQSACGKPAAAVTRRGKPRATIVHQE